MQGFIRLLLRFIDVCLFFSFFLLIITGNYFLSIDFFLLSSIFILHLNFFLLSSIFILNLNFFLFSSILILHRINYFLSVNLFLLSPPILILHQIHYFLYIYLLFTPFFYFFLLTFNTYKITNTYSFLEKISQFSLITSHSLQPILITFNHPQVKISLYLH